MCVFHKRQKQGLTEDVKPVYTGPEIKRKIIKR